MIKNLFLSILITIVFTTFYSCTTDFDINAEYEEIMVVYGLLNQADSIQYIKINKSFLGETNALTLAQNEDIQNYDDLEVKIEEWNNGNFVRTLEFYPITVSNKDDGVFYNPDQIIYRSRAYDYYDIKINNDTLWLNEDSEYRLFVKDILSGKEVSSITYLVSDFSIIKPRSTNTSNPKISFVNATSNSFEWKTSDNGRLYQLVVRFNYIETNLNTLDSTEKYVDWFFSTKRATYLDGSEEMVQEYLGQSFFENIRHNIDVDPDVTRRDKSVDLYFIVAGDDLSTYMEVTGPSNTIVMERPDYTNINNGIGIFSSRFIKYKKGFSLNYKSVDSLQSGIYTKDLGFYN